MTLEEIKRILNSNIGLSFEQEQTIFQYYKQYPSTELRNMIVEKNTGLVHEVVKHFNPKTIDLADLYQEGCIGLIRAVELFDPTYRVKFSTYAVKSIQHIIARYITNHKFNVRVPIHMYEDYLKIVQAMERYEKEHGSHPTYEYLYRELGLPVNKIKRTLHICTYAQTISLNRTVSDLHGHPDDILYLIPDPSDLEEDLAHDDQMQEFRKIIQEILTVREQLIISMRFGLDGCDPRTLVETGSYIGISRERVRQIESQALLKLQTSDQLSACFE